MSNILTKHQLNIREEDNNFIMQEYVYSDFAQRNYIEFDQNNVPVWAICFVYFRTGRLDMLKEFLVNYKGSLKGDTQEYDEFLSKYFANGGYLKNEDTRRLLESLNTGEQPDVFKQMLYFILAKHDEIPSEDLVARLGDYLWFNVRDRVSIA